MVLNKAVADHIWCAYFTETFDSYDAFGDLVVRNRHGCSEDIRGGWEIDWIIPLDKGGEQIFANAQILSPGNMKRRAGRDNGTIRDKEYGFEIDNVTNYKRMWTMRNGRKYWAYKRPLY